MIMRTGAAGLDKLPSVKIQIHSELSRTLSFETFEVGSLQQSIGPARPSLTIPHSLLSILVPKHLRLISPRRVGRFLVIANHPQPRVQMFSSHGVDDPVLLSSCRSRLELFGFVLWFSLDGRGSRFGIGSKSIGFRDVEERASVDVVRSVCCDIIGQALHWCSAGWSFFDLCQDVSLLLRLSFLESRDVCTGLGSVSHELREQLRARADGAMRRTNAPELDVFAQ